MNKYITAGIGLTLLLSTSVYAQTRPFSLPTAETMVSTNPVRVRAVTHPDYISNSLFETIHSELQPHYEDRNMTPGNIVHINIEKDGARLIMQDIIDPYPLNTTVTNDLGLRSNNHDIEVNGMDLSAYPTIGDGVTAKIDINSCTSISVTGKVNFDMFGVFRSRIELKKDGIAITSLEKKFYGLGPKEHEFDFNVQLESGTYELKHEQLIFGNTPIEQSSTSFVVQNSANCGSSVQYKSHVQGTGWMGWVSDGALTGTIGQSRRMEAVQIKLSGSPAPQYGICYSAHVRRKGWRSTSCNGQTSGTVGENRRMEAIKIWLTGAPSSCSVEYRSHVKGKGWMAWQESGQISGTIGERRRMEGLQVRLKGSC